jgi:hypothetical protein
MEDVTSFDMDNKFGKIGKIPYWSQWKTHRAQNTGW